MKRLLLLAIMLLSIAAINRNSFDFAEKPFGELKPSSLDCTEQNPESLYSDLNYMEKPSSHECWIRYRKKGKVIDLPDGRTKSTGSSVQVVAAEYKNSEILKQNWLTPININDSKVSIGLMEGSFNGEYSGNASWASGNFYILIIHSGDLPEIEEVYNYYLSRYPATLTFSESDLDPRKINERELAKHMAIINNSEKYRSLLRTKQDKYVGIMAQCAFEGKIRVAAGLCDDAFIDPEVELPAGQKPDVGCPIAMNFNDLERKKQWKEFEERALASDRLDFDPRTNGCPFVGLQWYFNDVRKKLLLTKPEVLLMYELGVPKNLLPDSETLRVLMPPSP
jgi:hypothetical protein